MPTTVCYRKPFPVGDWRTLRATLLTDPQWQPYWHPLAPTPWLFHRAKIFSHASGMS